METYVNKIASISAPPKEAVEVIIVTYRQGVRLEKKFYLEEQKDGKVDLITKSRDGVPARTDLDGVVW